jgi:hypothetical protein
MTEDYRKYLERLAEKAKVPSLRQYEKILKEQQQIRDGQENTASDAEKARMRAEDLRRQEYQTVLLEQIRLGLQPKPKRGEAIRPPSPSVPAVVLAQPPPGRRKRGDAGPAPAPAPGPDGTRETSQTPTSAVPVFVPTYGTAPYVPSIPPAAVPSSSGISTEALPQATADEPTSDRALRRAMISYGKVNPDARLDTQEAYNDISSSFKRPPTVDQYTMALARIDPQTEAQARSKEVALAQLGIDAEPSRRRKQERVERIARREVQAAEEERARLASEQSLKEFEKRQVAKTKKGKTAKK